MMKTATLKAGDKPSPEELKQLEKASSRPIVYDEDCPPLTDDEIAFYKQISPIQKAIGKKLTYKECRFLWEEWKKKSWGHIQANNTEYQYANA